MQVATFQGVPTRMPVQENPREGTLESLPEYKAFLEERRRLDLLDEPEVTPPANGTGSSTGSSPLASPAPKPITISANKAISLETLKHMQEESRRKRVSLLVKDVARQLIVEEREESKVSIVTRHQQLPSATATIPSSKKSKSKKGKERKPAAVNAVTAIPKAMSTLATLPLPTPFKDNDGKPAPIKLVQRKQPDLTLNHATTANAVPKASIPSPATSHSRPSASAIPGTTEKPALASTDPIKAQKVPRKFTSTNALPAATPQSHSHASTLQLPSPADAAHPKPDTEAPIPCPKLRRNSITKEQGRRTATFVPTSATTPATTTTFTTKTPRQFSTTSKPASNGSS